MDSSRFLFIENFYLPAKQASKRASKQAKGSFCSKTIKEKLTISFHLQSKKSSLLHYHTDIHLYVHERDAKANGTSTIDGDIKKQ